MREKSVYRKKKKRNGALRGGYLSFISLYLIRTNKIMYSKSRKRN